MKSNSRSTILIVALAVLILLAVMYWRGQNTGQAPATQPPATATRPAPTAPPPTKAPPTAALPTANPITDILWLWSSVTDQSTGMSDAVPAPDKYTIVFNVDGTLTGTADCNSFNGTYSQQNGFIIKLGATTLAYCGEASLDQRYLDLLNNVAAGGPAGAGNLALETAGGAQRMIFTNGGAAPK